MSDLTERQMPPEVRSEGVRVCRRLRHILPDSPLNAELNDFMKSTGSDFTCGEYFVLDKGETYERNQPADFIEKMNRWLDDKGISPCS